MDGELRDALQDIRDSVKDTNSSIHAKLDMANAQFNAHLVDDARNFQRLEMQASALKDRLDAQATTETTKGNNRWVVIAAIVGAVTLPALALLLNMLRGQRP